VLGNLLGDSISIHYPHERFSEDDIPPSTLLGAAGQALCFSVGVYHVRGRDRLVVQKIYPVENASTISNRRAGGVLDRRDVHRSLTPDDSSARHSNVTRTLMTCPTAKMDGTNCRPPIT
jgi:organic hydroperoxide reductase OsmC/OhrA